MSIIIEESKIVNKLVMTFEEISKLFNNIVDGSKYISLNKNIITNHSKSDDNPNSVEVEIVEDNPIYDYLLSVENCVFNVEDFIEVRKNKGDKIVKVEFFNEIDNSGIRITRESDLETIINGDEFDEDLLDEELNYSLDAINYFSSFEPSLNFKLDNDSLLGIKERKPSEFFKFIFTEDDVIVKDPYYIYNEKDYLIDFRTSKKYLLGLKYKKTKDKIVCPLVNIEIYAPETTVYSELIMVKFSIYQDKFVAKLKNLVYNI
ncbi:hypothetical protein CPT_Madawaska_139 [Staphylococcus phage Madawaska]|nr:hypothetical protein CPT_Madawaska_139 [Staphylococcus phage Madawaska]